MGSIGRESTTSGERVVNFGNAAYVRTPGTINYSGVRGAENPLQEDEIRLLQKDEDFSFNVTNRTNSGATRISILDDTGSEIATATLWYDEVEVHNRFTGSEDIYKNLRSALSGVRRRWNNMRRR